MVTRFAARWDGWCSHCGHPFIAGDEVAFVDDEIVAECCFDLDDEDGTDFWG